MASTFWDEARELRLKAIGPRRERMKRSGQMSPPGQNRQMPGFGARQWLRHLHAVHATGVGLGRARGISQTMSTSANLRNISPLIPKVSFDWFWDSISNGISTSYYVNDYTALCDVRAIHYTLRFKPRWVFKRYCTILYNSSWLLYERIHTIFVIATICIYITDLLRFAFVCLFVILFIKCLIIIIIIITRLLFILT